MRRIDLIKTLIPGFLPILIYIFADAFFGEKTGLLIAVLFGMSELLFGYIKDKRVDSFVVVDIALIVGMGLLSILLDTPLFFKLKPAVIESLLIAFLGYAMFSSKDVLTQMLSRYSGNAMTLPGRQQLRKLVMPLIVILSIHVVLTIVAAVWFSKEIWAFVSGGLFYIFLVAYMLVRIVMQKKLFSFWKKKYADDEWFDVLDENGRILYQAPRTVCHQDKDRLHAVVHLHVFDLGNRLYLQKRRADKLIQPDKWDSAVGGHVHSGETISAALLRESLEEICLDLQELKVFPLARYIWRSERESELVFTFYCQTQTKPNPNLQEIQEGRFWSAKQIREKMKQALFSENFEYEFNQFLQPLFDRATPHRSRTQ